jgi:hypothetical protein
LGKLGKKGKEGKKGKKVKEGKKGKEGKEGKKGKGIHIKRDSQKWSFAALRDSLGRSLRLCLRELFFALFRFKRIPSGSWHKEDKSEVNLIFKQKMRYLGYCSAFMVLLLLLTAVSGCAPTAAIVPSQPTFFFFYTDG